MASLQEYREERLKKLNELRQLGINPYPADSKRTHTNSEIVDNFKKLEGSNVHVVGRVVNIRKFGQIAFIVIRDATGQLQLFLKSGQLDKVDKSASELEYSQLGLLDSGDFVEANGKVIKTQTGEKSIEVIKLRIITKSIRPMPSDKDGFNNKEERLRRRYIDTNVNKNVYERYVRRSNFWQSTREFLLNEGFIEINVPVLEHTTGGADAKPFKTHMDAIGQDFYLRISHELPLKRLIGGGYERVFDIGPRFRNEHYTDEHLPEHVAFESYAAYQDYTQAMDLYERLIKDVAKKTWGKLTFKTNGFDVNLDQKWPVVRYPDIMMKEFKVDVFNPSLDQLKKILQDNKVKLDGEINTSRALDNVWKIIRRKSAGPFWLIHEPVEISPLAKRDPEDPRVTQRFHPVIAGTEMGNGYSELNDPIDQLNRFMDQEKLREAGDEEAQMLDIDFVEMLEYGMPPTTGWSYSERLFWALEGVTAREGVPFPQLRADISEVTKSIYPEVFKKQPIKELAGITRPQDFSRRIVSVVNKELKPWQVTNAVAHMNAIIGNELDKEQLTSGDVFVDKNGETIPRNSQYPIIVKKAEQKELHKLLNEIENLKLQHHVFIQEMQDTTNDEQIVNYLAKKTLDDTNFYGVTFIASNEVADKLTKKYRLYE